MSHEHARVFPPTDLVDLVDAATAGQGGSPAAKGVTPAKAEPSQKHADVAKLEDGDAELGVKIAAIHGKHVEVAVEVTSLRACGCCMA